MALQHHEFELERLRLFVQAGMAEWEMQSASLKQAELSCRRLELEARESAERDAAYHEVAMAKLAAEGALSTRAQVELELARVQRALGLAEEARRKAKFDHGAAQEALAAMGEACKKAEKKIAIWQKKNWPLL